VKRLIFAAACILLVWSAAIVGADPAKTSKSKKVAAKSADAVTYVGCLRTEDGGKKFVLTEVGGPNAPKSRNWKTAFITTKPGKLEIVAPGLKLQKDVGHTVQLTGRRFDKHFRAHAIKVIGTTCG
jgi:hypothetical protein